MKATQISAPEGVRRTAARADSIAQKGSGLVETVQKRRNRTFIPVEVSSTAVRFGGRQVPLSIARDISARKVEEARYRGLLEAAPDAMVVVDGRGEIVLLNVQAEKQFGYSRDELVGQPVTNIIPEGFAERIIADDLRSAADALAQVIGTGIELVALRKDGTEFPIEIMLSPLESAEGILVTAAIRDITARKASEARYRGLLEAAPDAMVVVDQRGEIVLLNVQAEKQFGYLRDELVGQPVTNIIPEGFAERIIADDLRSAEAALAQVIGTGIELVALRKDGTEFPIEIMLSPLENAEGILVTAAIRDITERRALEEGIRALNAELEERVRARTVALVAANAELEAFSYSVSHDLRAPLRSIDAFSQILLNEHAAPLDAEGRRILRIVLRNAKQMGTLIDDLLAFSRVSRASLDHRPVDMVRLVRGVVEELGEASQGRAIAIDVGPLADVPGDPALLRQVWANLLGNALKFTGPVAHPSVEIRSERVNGECRFTVRDNGVGFDPTYLDRLFAPFSRLHQTADFEGSGIGLAIVARIVARHGGRVWAEGVPGEGALFGFSIPTAAEAA
jgi:PAS domain S-box-containing protein